MMARSKVLEYKTNVDIKHIGNYPMTFIRAPYISEVSDGVDVLAKVDEKIVGVKYKNQYAFAFHPELDDNLNIHRRFVEEVSDICNRA